MTKQRRCGRFAECATCINREFDPFQCQDCTDASNYEPEDEGDEPESMDYDDFLILLRSE